MELNRKHIAIMLVVLFLGSVATAGVAIAQMPAGSSPQKLTSTAAPAVAGSGQTAPLNPEWTAYMNAKATGTVATQASSGGLGLEPTPIDFSQMNAGTGTNYVQAYPARYDLRLHNKVSPVKSQGSCGSCWAFATYGSLESYLRPASTTTYSEKALNNENGFSAACCQGGSWLKSTAYLARWGITMKYWNGGTIYSGPVTSTCDPYTLPYCTDSTTCPIVKHVQKVVSLPGRTTSLDNNAIKWGLQTYGALYVAFDWQPAVQSNRMVKTAYFNPTKAAYYDGTTTGANHGVTIVGWDDNFAKTNFSSVPPGNGAFIVKNSWGTSFGKSGYFYVSYYDKNFGRTGGKNAVAFTAESTTNYNTNYQYDPFGWAGNYGYGSNTAWGANVFTAKAGTLKAVGLYASSKNTAYTIYVYKNPSSTNPRSGTLVATKTGVITYQGYYTAVLPTSVPLSAGQKFSVVIKYTTPGYNYPDPVTMLVGGYDGNIPDSVPGHSFVSATGAAGTWNDLAVIYNPYYGYANNIHAFAS